MRRIGLKRTGTLVALALVVAASSRAADKEKIVWKSVPNAILQVDSRAPKIWNVFQAGKKFDPLLLQLGLRYLVIYVRNMEVFEIKPEQLDHKGEDLLWRETDKPAETHPHLGLEHQGRRLGVAHSIKAR